MPAVSDMRMDNLGLAHCILNHADGLIKTICKSPDNDSRVLNVATDENQFENVKKKTNGKGWLRCSQMEPNYRLCKISLRCKKCIFLSMSDLHHL